MTLNETKKGLLKDFLFDLDPIEVESTEFNAVSFDETGVVTSISDGIATIIGLKEVGAGEMVKFTRSGVVGMVLNLNENTVSAVVFGSEREVVEGDLVKRTETLVSVPTGKALL